MTRRATYLWSKRYFFLIPVLVGMVYMGSIGLSSASKKDKNIVKVNNLTQSCELSSVERHKGHIKVSIQNNSSKAIIAYVITSRIDSKTVFTFKEEFAFSEGDDVIASGQKQDKIIGLPASLNSRNEISLNLAAVIYDDNSSEGNPKIIQDVQDNRLGQKTQLMKVLPAMERLSRLPENEMQRTLNEDFKQDIEAALNKPDKQFLVQLKRKLDNIESVSESEQFKLGVQAGKEYVFQKYQELKDIQEKQGTSALREQVIGLRDLYTKMIAKF